MSAVLGIAAFAACGASASSADETNDGNPKDVYAIVVTVGGHQYNCAIYQGYKAGGLSCDWDHPIR
jgi:hypothetical protein